MMADHLPSLLAPVLVLALVSFLAFRLRFFSAGDVGGRYPFVFGSVCLLVASVWQAVTTLPGYAEWFVPSAYGVLTLARFGLTVIGLVLGTVALSLYADYWQTRRDDIEDREGKLSLLENLQHDARQPYQLLELLNISLKELLYHFPGGAGAMFLLNRVRRQFVLATESGLTKNEIAMLEHYPLGRNMFSQAVELGDPLIGGGFNFIGTDGQPIGSRFNSCLALPMVSGREKIGGVLLFSEENDFFGKTEIKYLTPVVEWLAEKIHAARLARETSVLQGELERRRTEQASLAARIASSARALVAPDAVDAYCRSVVQVAGSESVHLIGLQHGALTVYGGSEPLTDLTENYRTALLEAIDRAKPLIINQETTGDSGRPEVIQSSLIFPFSDEGGRDALLLRRASSAFAVDDEQLKLLDFFGRLGCAVLKQDSANRLSVTRRKGFEAVLQLLRVEAKAGSFENDPGFFMRHLAPVMPPFTAGVTLGRDEDGGLKVLDSHGVDGSLLSEFYVLPGEGDLGRAAAEGECLFAFGRKAIAAKLEAYEIHNRNALQRLMGERGLPSFMAACPVIRAVKVIGVVGMVVFDMEEAQRGEWERLLTLAVNLYSLRLTMAALQIQPEPAVTEAGEVEVSGLIVNQLNNHLSAVIGSAEWALQRPELSTQTREQLREIVAEAEKAAACIKQSLSSAPEQPSGAKAAGDAVSLDRTIKSVLGTSHISGNLYMAGGRAREIDLKLGSAAEFDFPSAAMRNLFESVLDRFGSIAEDDDVISVVTYREGEAVYLDVSRHRKNFPPVEPVAGFARYQPSGEALQARPSDVFLEHVAREACFYAVDRNSPAPAYLSFRFPVRSRLEPTGPEVADRSVRLLAIDDHSVILDLLSAMGQSLGYRVDTALRGQQGVRLAHENVYDVVLTDLAMPDMSGLEVARQIHARHPLTPIILVTGWEASLEREQLQSAGICEVLYKPFRIEQLTEIIQASVSGRA
ncbi:MAG TPA: response regulator [Acidobacteriota bacterium]|nr:response regulator [Acidobacteriota bacterium]